jgi:hypothetical protein
MITVYSYFTGSRVEYIVRHIFHTMLGADYVLTGDVDEYARATGLCVNYSPVSAGKGVWICPHGLLSEEGVGRVDVEMGRWDDLPCFFLQPQGDVPFDLFAAAFYLLTRYEEYAGGETDRFGRFAAEASLACREGFLQLAVVDRWVLRLKGLLTAGGGGDDFQARTFRMVATFDVDHPFCYRNKGLLKNLAGAARDMLHGNLPEVKRRLLTLLHLRQDPYMQSLAEIDALHKQHGREYFLFVHVGRYGKYDRRTVYPLRTYYRYLRSLYDVRFGLHPSFGASFNAAAIGREKAKLERILGFRVARNRQHFLRMKIPATCRDLAGLDFTEDFTLAYASRPGFRAGTAIPFYFFDLLRNEQTSLLLRPTVVMDATLMSYLRMQPEEALECIRALMMECKYCGGDFTMLWHPSSLAGGDGERWREVFAACFRDGVSLEKALPLGV